MKHTMLKGALAALTMSSALALGQAPAPGDSPAIDKPRGSYLMGQQFGDQLRSMGLAPDIDAEAMARGVKDALGGKSMSAQDHADAKTYINGSLVAARDRNKAAVDAFLAKNGKEKGVVTTASGLEYRIVNPGNAKEAAPTANDEVSVHYAGRLLDGTEFDSSYKRGTPTSFRVGGVIRGWQEALVLMKPGAKWQLWIPADLAYGDQGRPPAIPPGSMLQFDVELLSVKKADAATP